MYVVSVRKDSNYAPFPTQLAITRFIAKSIHTNLQDEIEKICINTHNGIFLQAVKETTNEIDNCLDLCEISLLKAFSLVKHNDK